MRDAYEIKELNSDYKMAAILSVALFVIGSLMLAFGGWKEIFIGAFFVIGSFVLVGLSISRKKKLNILLTSYLKRKLKEYFNSKNAVLRFVLERKKTLRFSYYIYVNGYVNKEDFEMFMQKFKEETKVKMEHRLLRKPASSIK